MDKSQDKLATARDTILGLLFKEKKTDAEYELLARVFAAIREHQLTDARLRDAVSRKAA